MDKGGEKVDEANKENDLDDVSVCVFNSASAHFWVGLAPVGHGGLCWSVFFFLFLFLMSD